METVVVIQLMTVANYRLKDFWGDAYDERYDTEDYEYWHIFTPKGLK